MSRPQLEGRMLDRVRERNRWTIDELLENFTEMADFEFSYKEAMKWLRLMARGGLLTIITTESRIGKQVFVDPDVEDDEDDVYVAGPNFAESFKNVTKLHEAIVTQDDCPSECGEDCAKTGRCVVPDPLPIEEQITKSLQAEMAQEVIKEMQAPKLPIDEREDVRAILQDLAESPWDMACRDYPYEPNKHTPEQLKSFEKASEETVEEESKVTDAKPKPPTSMWERMRERLLSGDTEVSSDTVEEGTYPKVDEPALMYDHPTLEEAGLPNDYNPNVDYVDSGTYPEQTAISNTSNYKTSIDTSIIDTIAPSPLPLPVPKLYENQPSVEVPKIPHVYIAYPLDQPKIPDEWIEAGIKQMDCVYLGGQWPKFAEVGEPLTNTKRRAGLVNKRSYLDASDFKDGTKGYFIDEDGAIMLLFINADLLTPLPIGWVGRTEQWEKVVAEGRYKARSTKDAANAYMDDMEARSRSMNDGSEIPLADNKDLFSGMPLSDVFDGLWVTQNDDPFAAAVMDRALEAINRFRSQHPSLPWRTAIGPYPVPDYLNVASDTYADLPYWKLEVKVGEAFWKRYQYNIGIMSLRSFCVGLLTTEENPLDIFDQMPDSIRGGDDGMRRYIGAMLRNRGQQGYDDPSDGPLTIISYPWPPQLPPYDKVFDDVDPKV